MSGRLGLRKKKVENRGKLAKIMTGTMGVVLCLLERRPHGNHSVDVHHLLSLCSEICVGVGWLSQERAQHPNHTLHGPLGREREGTKTVCLTGDKDPSTHQAHAGYIGSTDNK